MMGDELLPKRNPGKYQRIVTISGINHVKYSVKNSLDKPEPIQLVKFTAR